MDARVSTGVIVASAATAASNKQVNIQVTHDESSATATAAFGFRLSSLTDYYLQQFLIV